MVGTRVVAGILLLAALTSVPATGFAQARKPGSGGSPENLTLALIAAHQRHQRATLTKRAQRLADLLRIAASRHRLLAALTEADPAAVLRVALPAAIRASLPRAVQAYVEEHVDLDGVLEVLHEDRRTGSTYRYFLETGGARLALHFAAHAPALRSGSHVRVKGVRVGQTLALASGTTSVKTLTAALPNTLGAHSTVVLLVTFQDNPIQPYTLDDARSVVFGTASNFFLENSFQQTWLTGDVFGWYTIPLDSTVCDGFKIRDDAKAAATAAGVDLSPYATFVYAFPTNSACGYSGMAQIGGPNVWINGSLELKVVGHELGHVLGLYHSHALECGTTTLGTDCTTYEYGDIVDIMGNSSAGHFNAFQKEQLGWLGIDIATVGATGVYTLDPYEAPLGWEPKALKFPKGVDAPTGQTAWYYVELRQAIGFDSFLSANSNVLNGVVIHTGADGDINSSNLLDTTPGSTPFPDQDWTDPALAVGRSFSDPNAGVTITLTSAGTTGAAVSVTLASPACTSANPAVALSPSESQWVTAGTSVTYTVSITNQDNAGCAASTFNLQGSAPAGWTEAFAAPTLTLSPGASAPTTLRVTSPVSVPDGFYPIDVTAANSVAPNNAGAASATYVIVSALTVTMATDKASYTRNQTVSMTAVVTRAGAPVAGAGVTFTVTKPNGAVVTGTATTGTNGAAVFKLRIKPKDPVGAYGIRADAIVNGNSGSATASFTVQ